MAERLACAHAVYEELDGRSHFFSPDALSVELLAAVDRWCAV